MLSLILTTQSLILICYSLEVIIVFSLCRMHGFFIMVVGVYVLSKLVVIIELFEILTRDT